MEIIDANIDDAEHHAGATEPWMRQANCRGVDASAFFPRDGGGIEAARRVCAGCAVRAECLEYALDNRLDHGVWGGTSERERQRILRDRRSAAATGDGRRVTGEG
jgi:WhiB family redox-sensing transcriptional regulator